MDIVRSVKTLAFKGVALAQKYAPEILTTVGIAGMATSTVLIAKQTLKLEGTIDRAEVRIAVAKDEKAGGDSLAVVKAYLDNTGDIVKLYGAPVMLGVASVASILAAHGIMRRRNAALVAAYGVLESAFANYRNRVREVIGEEKEHELYLGVREVEVAQKGSGKKTTVKDGSTGPLSPYALLFDESNRYWEAESGTNKTFLLIKQQHFNDMLYVRGHLFLNDVHRALGFPETKAGQAVGWVYDSETGDGYVDLGIYIPDSDVKRDFINGHEPSIWLNPNVDGPILHRLP